MSDLFIDNGKPVEKQGRKAKGPKAKAMAAWPPKEKIFYEKNNRFSFTADNDGVPRTVILFLPSYFGFGMVTVQK
jgi:hypothetical protein